MKKTKIAKPQEDWIAEPPCSPVVDQDAQTDLDSILEAMLFVANEPMTIEKMLQALGEDTPRELLEQRIADLQLKLQQPHRGIELVFVGGGYQLRTKPVHAQVFQKMAKIQVQRLSPGLMETLAIIAYQQPVLKDEVDQIRGVDSAHFIRHLLEKQLIQMAGRSELPGRPILYATSPEFLKIFGLGSLSDLPPLSELSKMIPNSEVKPSEQEDPLSLEIRRTLEVLSQNPNSKALELDPAEDQKILEAISQHLKSIATTTPTLEQMKEQQKQPQALHETTAPSPPKS